MLRSLYLGNSYPGTEPYKTGGGTHNLLALKRAIHFYHGEERDTVIADPGCPQARVRHCKCAVGARVMVQGYGSGLGFRVRIQGQVGFVVGYSQTLIRLLTGSCQLFSRSLGRYGEPEIVSVVQTVACSI